MTKAASVFTYGRRCKTEWIINRRNVEGIYMKKRKATLCLALAAVFGISSVAGCSKDSE